jgi:hypothetical protein
VRPEKIVSGGQTGVDRGALEAAIALGIAHGGWCPRGRLAEDGPIPARYELVETESPEYRVRTERNVLDSDATLLLVRGVLRGGTKYTRQMAVRHRKPWLVVDLGQPADDHKVREWLEQNGVSVLNIAGPRESQSPGITEQAYQWVRRLFGSD